MADLFRIDPHDVIAFGNYLAENAGIMIHLPDRGKYIAMRFEKRAGAQVVAVLQSTDPEEEKECEISTTKLMELHAQMTLIRPIHTMPILSPVRDGAAQERSDAFARFVYAKRKPHERVLILDGPGRNLFALLKAGIPANRIIMIEKNPQTAFYHKLISLCLNDGLTTIYTGKGGLEEFIVAGKFAAESIAFFYADFCGFLPGTFSECLDILINQNGLHTLCVTRCHRSVQPLPSIGDKLCLWRQTAVICQLSSKLKTKWANSLNGRCC